MSFDEGNAGTSPDYEIKARLRAAIDAEGIKWNEIVERSGFTSDQIRDAVLLGADGLPRTVPILTAICMMLNRDLNWLLAGSLDCETKFKESLKERVVRLVWEFIYKRRVPEDLRSKLVNVVKGMVDRIQCNTFQAAHRSGIPTNWKDVAAIYDIMSKRDSSWPRGD